jgi:phage N-6-adenine-methyltransferase
VEAEHQESGALMSDICSHGVISGQLAIDGTEHVCGLSPLMSSQKMDWRTPGWLLEGAREVFGQIGLDPATEEGNPTGAVHYYTPEQDGLSRSWTDVGLVWVNPPYGRGLIHWAAKMAEEAAEGAEILALVPARTDTAWWQEYMASADVVCFIRGRIKFEGADNGAPFPSALVYWGNRAELFARAYGNMGWVVCQ